jgi:hypothetical protein
MAILGIHLADEEALIGCIIIQHWFLAQQRYLAAVQRDYGVILATFWIQPTYICYHALACYHDMIAFSQHALFIADVTSQLLHESV